nr:hypothetical protein [Tanacetum cinerariifolium]
MRLKEESEERPGARFEANNAQASILDCPESTMIGNVRSAKNITDAEDFGPTTKKDGNINLVKEVMSPNRRTDQTESQRQDCSCNVEQRVPEMIT